MIKQNYPKQDIEEMRALLCHEGWAFQDYLPKDWMIRKTEGTRDGVYDVDFWLLNVEGTVFRSTKTATEFLANSSDYNQDDIDKALVELDKEGPFLTKCY